ncbi:MAG: hypothetical protein Q9163_006420 [Psora crenata]
MAIPSALSKEMVVDLPSEKPEIPEIPGKPGKPGKPEESLSPLPPSSSPSLSPPNPTPPPSRRQRLRAHLAADVTTDHADILFLLCCFISGLVDSTIYNAYGTFVSMQTGNTIFLGLGGATPDSTSKPYGWSKSLASISCFCLGCFLFARTTRYLGHRRRSTLVLSFFVQTLIIFAAAAVVQAGAVDGALNTISDDIDWWTMIPIALLSFQSAGQIVGSRALNLAEIPTVVLTSMLHDIATDPKLLAGLGENVKRNRRVCAFWAILIGAVTGGFVAEGTERMQIPLWVAGGVKLGVTVAWTCWPETKHLPV